MYGIVSLPPFRYILSYRVMIPIVSYFSILGHLHLFSNENVYTKLNIKAIYWCYNPIVLYFKVLKFWLFLIKNILSLASSWNQSIYLWIFYPIRSVHLEKIRTVSRFITKKNIKSFRKYWMSFSKSGQTEK